jgi:predicted dehydrogenase
MDEVLRVAFVGAGSLANRMHYPSVAERSGVEIAAIAELDAARLADTAGRFGVEARYADYRAMLREVRPDVVYVVMPPMGLSPIVVDCLEAGAHVFIEKPPGVDLADCERMASAAASHGRATMVGFNRRFAPVLREARRLVAERGPVAQVMSEFHKDMLATGPYYGMNILRTDVIHAVDAVRWLAADEVEGVSAVNQRAYADWENGHTAMIRFREGAVGLLAAHRGAGGRYERFELHGRGVSAYVRAPEHAEIWFEGVPEPRRLDGAALAGSADPRISYGYAGESAHFLDAVRAGRTPEADLADALRTMRLVEAIADGHKARID